MPGSPAQWQIVARTSVAQWHSGTVWSVRVHTPKVTLAFCLLVHVHLGWPRIREAHYPWWSWEEALSLTSVHCAVPPLIAADQRSASTPGP